MEHDGLDILIFGAHPDDAEIGMGATICKHTNAGYRVGICDLTYAEMSSNGTVDTRKQEAEEAGRLLGLSVRCNLGFPDRGLRFSDEQIADMVKVIRKYRPKLVFAPYWQDRHPDHILCGRMAEEAVFNAKLRKYDPDTAPFTVERLYYYFINDLYEPQFVIDVSEVYETKHRALMAYRTQFFAEFGHVPTPINQDFLNMIEMRDRLSGHKLGFRYGEGFVCKQPMTVHLL